MDKITPGLIQLLRKLSHAIEHGQSRERASALDRAIAMDPPEIAGFTPVAVAASALFRHESVITRAALLEAALIEAGQRGIGIDPVYAELGRLEQDGTLLRLGPDQSDGQRWTTPSIARGRSRHAAGGEPAS